MLQRLEILYWLTFVYHKMREQVVGKSFLTKPHSFSNKRISTNPPQTPTPTRSKYCHSDKQPEINHLGGGSGKWDEAFKKRKPFAEEWMHFFFFFLLFCFLVSVSLPGFSLFLNNFIFRITSIIFFFFFFILIVWGILVWLPLFLGNCCSLVLAFLMPSSQKF